MSVKKCGLALCLVFLTGCINQKMNIVVNPDGSGHIVLTRTFTKAGVDMIEASLKQMEQQMASMGASGNMPGLNSDPFYNEKQLKAQARLYGEGVEYVKSQKIDQNGARGAIVLYSFKDINQVQVPVDETRMSMSMSAGMMDSDAMESMYERDQDGDAVLFTFVPGATKTLKIQMPDKIIDAIAAAKDEETPKAPAVQTPTAETGQVAVAEETEEADEATVMTSPAAGMPGAMGGPFGAMMGGSEEEMMKTMFKGMRMTLSVEVKGQVRKATAAHPAADKPQRFTLYDFDFDKMMTAPGFKESLEHSTMGPSITQFIKMPGAVVETNRDVMIEFE